MQEVGGNEKAPHRAGQLAVLAIEVDFGSLPFRLGAQDVLGYPFDLELGEFEGCGFHIAKGSEVMTATGAEQVVGIIGRIAHSVPAALIRIRCRNIHRSHHI